jgi:hypothetical protein
MAAAFSLEIRKYGFLASEDNSCFCLERKWRIKMKTCPHCQTENLDVAWKCKSFGIDLSFSQEQHFAENPYGLAKTSLVFGCLSALVVPAILGSLLNSPLVMYISMVSFGIVAVITGVRALSEIKQTHEKGKGMAIAGIVLGGLFSILALCSFAGIMLGPILQEQFEGIQRGLGTPAP